MISASQLESATQGCLLEPQEIAALESMNTVGNLAIEIKLSSPASQFLKPIMKSGHPASQFLYTCVLPSRRNPHPPAPLFAGGGRNFRWWWAMYGGNVATQVCPITVAMFITSALLVACDISDGLIWSPSWYVTPLGGERVLSPGESPVVGGGSGGGRRKSTPWHVPFCSLSQGKTSARSSSFTDLRI